MDYATGGQLNLVHKVQIKPPILRKRDGIAVTLFILYLSNIIPMYLTNI